MTHRALLIGKHVDYLWQLPPMLHRCGFEVDLVTTEPETFTGHPQLRRVHNAPNGLLAAALAAVSDDDHDWVIPTDNTLLHQLAHRIDIPEEHRMRLAPITGPEHLGHLSSKAGLSRRLMGSGIPTPETVAVTGPAQASEIAASWGYPVVVKLDVSAAGKGVVIARSAADIDLPAFRDRRLVVQRYRPGRDLGISAVFLEGSLVHMSMGLGHLRRTATGEWVALLLVPSVRHPDVVAEVAQLGSLLGIHGCANITAILSDDGQRWYIEADTRPNVWITRGAEVGDDPMPRIEAYRQGRRGPMLPGEDRGEFVAAYFPRLSREEFDEDRFGVHRQIPQDDPVAQQFLSRLRN